MRYYVNKNTDDQGDHEVHEHSCSRLPLEENRRYLGDFSTCPPAVRKAREYYERVNGCWYCSRPCHTS